MIYEILACKRVEGSDRGLLRGIIQARLKENHEICKDTRLNIVRIVHHVPHYPSAYQLSSTTPCFCTHVSVSAPTLFANSWFEAP